MIYVENLDDLPALHRAAYLGDEFAIRAAIEDGIAVDTRADTGGNYGPFFQSVTPLMIAAASPNNTLSAMRLLLKLGADPLAKSAVDVTALWYVAYSGESSRLQLLLALNNNPNETAHNGQSLITEAARAGDLDSVNLLLEAGVSPHPFGKAGGYANAWEFQIPLFCAAMGGSAACVEVLLGAGAPATALDKQKRTALAYATTEDVVDVLVKAGCPLISFDEYNHTGLDSALDEGREEVVRALVAAGASLEMKDQSGLSALARYCYSFEIDAAMVQLLIDLGADIHVRVYENERTLLHLAVQLIVGDRRGKLGDVVRVLVKAGLPVDIRNGDGYTPLHIAVGNEGVDDSAIEALLELGTDVNAATPNGETPLMIAVDEGYKVANALTLLLRQGADVRQAVADGTTVHEFAIGRVKSWERMMVSFEEQTGEITNMIMEVLADAREVLGIIEAALENNA